MTQARREQLEGAGICVEQALERMMGSEALLERLLGKFLEDRNLPALREALAAGDTEGAFTAAHTLKGVCGNLSMAALYDLFTRQTEALRCGDLAGARAQMAEIEQADAAVRAAIRGDADEA